MFLTPFLDRFFFDFGSQIPSKMHPKTFQKKHAFRDRFFYNFLEVLGPSWRHLGSKLAPTFANLAPFWASRGRPKSTKIGQDRHLSIFRPKLAPRSSQTPSGPRFFPVWGSFLNRFFVIFQRIRVQLLL